MVEEVVVEDIKKLNNKKNIKKILILMSLIISIITIYQISNIFAIFYSEATGTQDIGIADWVIIVNNKDIVGPGTIQAFDAIFNIEANAVNGKLAPGVEGYFDIKIEPRTTKVDVRYDLTIDLSDFEGIDIDVGLTSVKETAENNILIRTGASTYTGIMPVSKINNNYFNNIRVTFKWEGELDAEENQLIEVAKHIVKVPMKLRVSQYTGEGIDAYIE